MTDRMLDQVIAVIADVLDMTPDQLGLHTEGADVPAWDSFGHVRIVLALEAEFGVELTLAEIEQSGSVQGLVSAVEAARRRTA